jgi:hypothetical protein
VAVLDAEVRLDTTVVRDPFDPGSGLMSIEVIDNEQPRVLRCLGNSLLDVGQKVGLGAARPHAGRYHPPGSDFQVGDQAQRAMAVIFMFNAGHLTHPHRLGGVVVLQGLNTRFLIGRHQMNPKRMELSGLAIERTNSAHLGIKGGLVLRLSIEPVATQRRFDLRFL